MKPIYLFLTATLFILFACGPANNEDNNDSIEGGNPTKDAHSYANLNEVHTDHLHIDLDINFEEKSLYGVARHTLAEHNSDTVVFDIKALEILRVTVGKENETETDFVIGESDELLGAPLSVKVKTGEKHVNIYYETTNATEAIDWLSPELTTGKKHPYMYTQGQAILTRSWIPLQDSPMNRITYSADVKVPVELMAIMSADNPTEKSADGMYHFEMKQRIPSYLIAIAVGNLTYTKLGDNCGVYSEPELAEQCAYEFVDLPKMLSAAENLYGDYRWEQFDIALLPYSFPFGGMENPRLTFANPTLLAGDRSLVTVIAHELAHSWSGNLVTNATWNDFWLNEGFTVYFENRIMEELYGKEVSDILAVIERQDLDAALDDLGNGAHPEDTHLKLELDERSPDDGMTDIAYVKGAYFLRTLENEVGREKFDEFLNKYFNKFAFETITTEDFVAYLNTELLEPNNIEFNTEEWIYQPGLPENCIKVSSARLDKMTDWANEANSGKDIFVSNKVSRSDYTTQEWLAFIRGMSDDVSLETMTKIDEQLKFSQEANPVIKSEWFQLAVRTGYTDARPHMAAHLKLIGRRWLIEGIYKTLSESTEEDLEWAKNVFEETKNNYHFVSRSTIHEILYN